MKTSDSKSPDAFLKPIETSPMANTVDVRWQGLYRAGGIAALLNVFDIVDYALVAVTFLALYGALRRASPSVMAVAVTFRPARDCTVLRIQSGVLYAVFEQPVYSRDHCGREKSVIGRWAGDACHQ
ncbi:MAG: hypothetical protein ACLQUY_25480 [Ktedonobacterales bacterium]